jgi:bacterioferritin
MMQGDPKILERLADLLASELSAASTYFVHSKMRENWGYPELAKRAYDDSIDEMRHAEKLIERIIYFEGTPNLQRLNRIRVGSGVTDQFQNELALEKTTVEALVAAIALCREVGDDGTRLIFEPMLTDGEQSIDWLETQLDLIEKLGEATYLAQHIRGGE